MKSPNILELSGIGDPAVLGPLGIFVQLDLPAVGANMQDHVIGTRPICSTLTLLNMVCRVSLVCRVSSREIRGVHDYAAGPCLCDAVAEILVRALLLLTPSRY